MKKLITAVLMLGAAGAISAPDMDKFNKSCQVCHGTGAAGAPKVGDVAAWAPRLEKGMPALLQSVQNGINAMPPKGMCFDCSDADYTALIEYMSAPAK